jgi:hypothetical protein
MTKVCKLCRLESTPWEYIDVLDGHVCADCSYRLAVLFVNDGSLSRADLLALYVTEAWKKAELP